MNAAKNDFITVLLVDQTPVEVFNAVKNPQVWWPGIIHGKTLNLNDEFDYRYKDFHFSKQRIVELIPYQKIVWLVTDSVINYALDKHEWTGTKICFEITKLDEKTQLSFTHIGLDQGIECFDSCSASWHQIIHESLLSLITIGKGKKIFLG